MNREGNGGKCLEKYFSSAEEKKNGKGKDLDQGKNLSLRKGGKYIENENIFFLRRRRKRRKIFGE